MNGMNLADRHKVIMDFVEVLMEKQTNAKGVSLKDWLKLNDLVADSLQAAYESGRDI